MTKSNAMPPQRAAARACWVALAMSLLVAPALTHAQTNPASCQAGIAPYRFLRFNEDFGFLRDPACRSDAWDGLKYLPFGASASGYLSVGGDLRLQLVNARYLSFGTEGGDNRNVSLERLHVHANARFSPSLRVFAELKTNHQQGREPRALLIDVDRLDWHQGFVDFGSEREAQLRIGRQELIFGSGRRIFPRNGPNVRGNFDAVRATVNPADWRVDAFVFRPVEIDPGTFDDGKINTQAFWGVYGVSDKPMVGPLRLDVYYLGAHRKNARFSQGVANEHRHSIGARLFGRTGAWDFDNEATVQWGNFGAGSIRAWAVTGEAGHTWVEHPSKPRVSLRVDAASGDNNAADPDLQTFNAFLPKGGVISDGFNLSPANVVHARAGVDWNLAPSLKANVALETNWRNSRRDGIYGPGGGQLRAPNGSQEKHIGNALDASVIWNISRHATFMFGFGKFRSGKFIEQSGPARDMSFATATYLYRF